MSASLRLIVGLGNPGPRYDLTRHNAGFWFVDALAARAGATFRSTAKFPAEACEVSVDGHGMRLLKPQTYMNRSGAAVAPLANFYKLAPESILVVHDEIDLPPGQVRLKRGGGHGGHNGLRDIIAQLGSRDFVRLRIGVGHPGSAEEVVDYVLRRAPAEEQSAIEDAMHQALAVLPRIVAGDVDKAMNLLHRKTKETTGGTESTEKKIGSRRRANGTSEGVQ